jgi:hypothetical protein
MARISKNHLMGRILPRPRVKRGEKQRAGTLVTQRIVSKTLLVKYSEITYAFKETIYMHDSQTANSHLSKRHVQDRFIILFRAGGGHVQLFIRNPHPERSQPLFSCLP